MSHLISSQRHCPNPVATLKRKPTQPQEQDTLSVEDHAKILALVLKMRAQNMTWPQMAEVLTGTVIGISGFTMGLPVAGGAYLSVAAARALGVTLPDILGLTGMVSRWYLTDSGANAEHHAAADPEGAATRLYKQSVGWLSSVLKERLGITAGTLAENSIDTLAAVAVLATPTLLEPSPTTVYQLGDSAEMTVMMGIAGSTIKYSQNHPDGSRESGEMSSVLGLETRTHTSERVHSGHLRLVTHREHSLWGINLDEEIVCTNIPVIGSVAQISPPPSEIQSPSTSLVEKGLSALAIQTASLSRNMPWNRRALMAGLPLSWGTMGVEGAGDSPKSTLLSGLKTWNKSKKSPTNSLSLLKQLSGEHESLLSFYTHLDTPNRKLLLHFLMEHIDSADLKVKSHMSAVVSKILQVLDMSDACLKSDTLFQELNLSLEFNLSHGNLNEQMATMLLQIYGAAKGSVKTLQDTAFFLKARTKLSQFSPTKIALPTLKEWGDLLKLNVNSTEQLTTDNTAFILKALGTIKKISDDQIAEYLQIILSIPLEYHNAGLVRDALRHLFSRQNIQLRYKPILTLLNSDNEIKTFIEFCKPLNGTRTLDMPLNYFYIREAGKKLLSGEWGPNDIKGYTYTPVFAKLEAFPDEKSKAEFALGFGLLVQYKAKPEEFFALIKFSENQFNFAMFKEMVSEGMRANVTHMAAVATQITEALPITTPKEADDYFELIDHLPDAETKPLRVSLLDHLDTDDSASLQRRMAYAKKWGHRKEAEVLFCNALYQLDDVEQATNYAQASFDQMPDNIACKTVVNLLNRLRESRDESGPLSFSMIMVTVAIGLIPVVGIGILKYLKKSDAKDIEPALLKEIAALNERIRDLEQHPRRTLETTDLPSFVTASIDYRNHLVSIKVLSESLLESAYEFGLKSAADLGDESQMYIVVENAYVDAHYNPAKDGPKEAWVLRQAKEQIFQTDTINFRWFSKKGWDKWVAIKPENPCTRVPHDRHLTQAYTLRPEISACIENLYEINVKIDAIESTSEYRLAKQIKAYQEIAKDGLSAISQLTELLNTYLDVKHPHLISSLNQVILELLTTPDSILNKTINNKNNRDALAPRATLFLTLYRYFNFILQTYPEALSTEHDVVTVMGTYLKNKDSLQTPEYYRFLLSLAKATVDIDAFKDIYDFVSKPLIDYYADITHDAKLRLQIRDFYRERPESDACRTLESNRQYIIDQLVRDPSTEYGKINILMRQINDIRQLALTIPLSNTQRDYDPKESIAFITTQLTTLLDSQYDNLALGKNIIGLLHDCGVLLENVMALKYYEKNPDDSQLPEGREHHLTKFIPKTSGLEILQKYQEELELWPTIRLFTDGYRMVRVTTKQSHLLKLLHSAQQGKEAGIDALYTMIRTYIDAAELAQRSKALEQNPFLLLTEADFGMASGATEGGFLRISVSGDPQIKEAAFIQLLDLI